MIDKDLIESIINGNKHAFKTLFYMYKAKVYRTAYLILKDKQNAEDVVQDTFLQVYLKLHNLSNVEAFDIWLYRITVNQCTNFINKTKKVHIVEIDDQLEKDILFSQSNICDIETTYIQKETKEKLVECMYSLPMKFRTVLTLYYFNEMTIPQIAQIINCSEGTVKSRLFYGKKKFKKILTSSEINISEREEDLNYEIR